MKLLTYKELLNFQLVLFLDELTTVKSVDVLNAVSKNLGSLFPNEPDIVHKPIDKTGKTSPVIMFKNNNIYGLTIAQNKCEFVFNNGAHLKTYLQELLETVKKIEQLVREDLNMVVHRVGIIVNYIVPYKNEWEFSIDHKAVVNQNENYQAINMSWLEKVMINDLFINKWVKYIKNIAITASDLVTVDMNTLPEESLSQKKVDVLSLINGLIDFMEEDI